MKGHRIKLFLFTLVLFLFACSPTDEPADSTVEVEDQPTEDVETEDTEDDAATTEEDSSVTDSDNASNERLAEFYIDLMDSGNYTLVYRGYYEEEGSEQEVLFTMSYRDDEMAMQIEDLNESIKATTIMEEEEVHIVNHEDEMVLTMPLTQMQETLDGLQELENVETDELEFVGEGTDTFVGNTREYEEYTDGETHIFYYFDGDTLDGMAFVTNGDRTAFDLESISDGADETLFNIPEHYERTSLNF